MALDDCTEHPATEEQARASMERSMRWAERSHRHYYAADAPPGGLFGIVQGGMHAEPAPGLPGGAVCAWTGRDWRWAASRSGSPRRSVSASWRRSCRTCRPTRPRYLMGVGRPEDIVAAVLRGIDMFDCVMPTRHARNGHLFTSTGVINIRNSATRRTGAGRSGLRLLHLPQLQPRLPAPPGSLQRDPRFAPQHDPQPAFLPAADALAAGSHPGRRPRAWAGAFLATRRGGDAVA